MQHMLIGLIIIVALLVSLAVIWEKTLPQNSIVPTRVSADIKVKFWNKKHKIVLETHPNQDIRTYHFTHKNIPSALIIELSEINGIISVDNCSDEYKISITKGRAFNWSGIETKFLQKIGQK